MNLLMITGDRSLAVGKHGAYYNTLEGLSQHFDRIDVICPHPREIFNFQFPIFGNVYIHPSPLPLIFQWWWIWHEGIRIIRAQKIKNSKLKIAMTVHEYAPVFNGVGARLLSHMTGVPYMLEVMHIPGVPRASGLRERLNRWLTQMYIASEARSAVAIRVINQYETSAFLISAGVPSDKLVYIPAFYIDLEVFRPQEAEKKYDLVFVGRLARNKGLDLFLEVVRLTGLRALIVGDGPLRQWAELKAKSYKLNVVLYGFAKDAHEVAGLINSSRLLAMTSLNEGGPRVVLEALACGVPVVATPVGIVPDVLSPECIEEWNAGDFSAKVRNMLSDEQLYARVRESGLFVVKQFEKKAAIRNYADKIKNLVA